jgi:hypothetical protein
MVCHYHPERESTDVCAICGKKICKECGLEIAGKIYCKECLQKIVGLSLDTQSQVNEPQEEARPEPARLEKQPEQNIYDVQEEVSYEAEPQEVSKISADSPYNIKDNIEYTGGLESSYISENEPIAQEAPALERQPQAAQDEIEFQPQQQVQSEPEYIYPDHSYQPEPTSARLDLEDKYEKYLDDLYFDEQDVPLGEQLAKDEEQYGSLTRKEYKAPEKPAEEQKRAKPNRPETPEEMEARIRAEILEEQGIKPKKDKKGRRNRDDESKSIHNLNYQDEKEPMGAVDILLTIVLVIVILIVIYYIVYLFVLHASYPTFMDAVYGLTNPQNVINNLLSSRG